MILSFRINDKVRFILERLKFIDKHGRVISPHGDLSNFINLKIVDTFQTKGIERAWLKQLIIQRDTQIRGLEKEMSGFASQLRSINRKEEILP